MTISSEVRKSSIFTGNGTTDTFPFAFKVFSTADVVVVKTLVSSGVETTLTLTTDYTVSLNADQDSDPGGDVVLNAVLATGYTLIMTSGVTPLQAVDLTNQGGFYPSVINAALDRLTILVQQVKEQVGRAVKVDISSTTNPDELIDQIAENALVAQASATAAAAAASIAAQASEGWFDFGHAPTYASVSSFTVAGDQTATYHANRPIKCTDATTLYGKVASSSYSAPNTTVNVTLDSGSLSGSLSAVALGSAVTGFPVGVDGLRGVSAFIKTLLDDTDASTALSTLGLSAFVKTLMDDADAATFLSTLGLSSGTGSSLVGFTQAGTGAVSRTAQDKARETVSIKDFGAVGDWNGSTGTNNTAAFNNALAKLKAAGGGTLKVPYGNYYLTGLVGNAPQDIADWNHNTEIVGEKGATLTFLGTYSGACLSLNGNNVAVRNLAVTSTRTINHHADLDAQRVVYQLGIMVGGKNNVGTIDTYKRGAQVTNCTVTNMNAPITAVMAGNIVISDNTVSDFTDTGIMGHDCTTDIWIERNKVTNGGDDHIFLRHYPTTPWATAGNYCGRVHVKDNILNDTFAKNIGIGGFGDVDITGNYCGLSFAGGINLEKDDWYKTNALNYKNYNISGNTVVDPGRNWNTSEAVAAHRIPATGANPSGIHTVYANTFGAINYQNVNIKNNIISNPYYSCISLSAVDWLNVTGNTCALGSTNHGAGAVPSTGVIFDVISQVTNATFGNNKTSTHLGVTPVYTSSVASGTGTTSNITFANNLEVFTTEAVSYSDGPARSATTYSTMNYGDRGAVTFAAAVTAAVTLTRYQPDANYRVSLGPQGNNTFWVSDKTTSGFTINAATSNSLAVEWILSR